MSFWDRYLAPGDVRAQHHALNRQHERARDEVVTAASTAIKSTPHKRLDPASRARRQNGLLLGGAIFTALSILITRRAVARKISTILPTETPATDTVTKMSAGLDGAQALVLATMNVFSFGILGIGAAAKLFDVADVEDMRDKVRSSLGYDVYGGDAAADEELEAWVAEIMARKDVGLRESVTSKLAELERIEKAKKEAANGKG